MRTALSTIAVQADGKILMGGAFTSIGGQTAQHASLGSMPPPAWQIHSIRIRELVTMSLLSQCSQTAKFWWVALFFSIGGQPRNHIARLDPTTGLADSFDPTCEAGSWILMQSWSNRTARSCGGAFINLSPNGGAAVARNRVARVETDGRLDQTLNLNIVGTFVLATAVQPDGKILIGGNFTTVLGVARNNIARLNTDGTLDTAFDPNANNSVYSIAVQADGKILAGGWFHEQHRRTDPQPHRPTRCHDRLG